ncbi:MAG: hypothetical protein ACE5H8_00210 [Alphaproteobacteria bacterium]
MTVGNAAEALAVRLLKEHGFDVVNLNERRRNYPVFDLLARKQGRDIRISVKCARAKRELRLGKPQTLEKMPDEGVVMASCPSPRAKRSTSTAVVMSYGSSPATSRATRA